MDARQLGLLGSVLLIVGVFLPIVSLPIVGSLNYFQNGRGDGTVVLIAGLVGLAATQKRVRAAMIAAAAVALLLLLVTFVRFESMLSHMRGEMAEAAHNPFLGGIAAAMVQAVQLQWGWVVLVAGGLCLLAGGLRTPRRTP